MANNNPNEIKIELSPEVAKGIYSNLAVISHGANEFFLDFITMAPNMPQAKVQSRVIMTPENAKNLLGALMENVKKYEATFGEIRPKRPVNGGGNPGGEIPNPFIMAEKPDPPLSRKRLMNLIENNFSIYNTLTRTKQLFKPLHEGKVGMYVCGPTVYGDGHLGHARPAITFDVLFRYLRHLGYKVRYVRNITDVGHLEHDADDGEDKIAKKARLEQLEPMEVVQHYLTRYHKAMEALNVLPPSIEPHASGHIIEQIEYIKKILESGYAYISDGSVYFDVPKFNRDHPYGKLSGRNVDELLSNTRELDGQDQKHHPADFALWKKAAPEHIMHWPSPWSEGFPGWHLECSTMGEKYLGESFDIHGGGMDLMFPHHECEIAQSVAHNGHDTVRYWMHNNMITINGKKMGKSLGNFITLDEFFNGTHPLLEQPYSPMTIRFFILQAHYRGTVDFSNEALKASEKALGRMLEGYRRLQELTPSESSTIDVSDIRRKCYEAMDDDMNTPMVIANLFDALRLVNQVKDGHATATQADIDELKTVFDTFLVDILGVRTEMAGDSAEALKPFEGAVELLLDVRAKAKASKDWATSDLIRDRLAALGFTVKDTKDGAEWSLS